MSTTTLDRIRSEEATVGVVGLGYVGLPLALTFCQGKFQVVGFDVDERKVERLQASESYIRHIPADRIDAVVSSGQFKPTTDYAHIRDCDAVLLCVPTPLTAHREPDMTYVIKTAEAVGPHLHAGQLVILESTTYPGTTDGVLKRVLEEKSGLEAGKDFHLAYSPEREDPGNPDFDTKRIPKVVGGLTPACRETAETLYGAVLDQVVPVRSARAAELTKLFENIFRSVNIALVNELKVLCEKMEIDVWEVIDAAATKPFGFMPFYPGPGLGGHCIPIDPFYLTWKAREFGMSTRFIELAGEINTRMPHYVVEQTARALNTHRKPVSGAKILVVGVAYKKDVDDMRESPALEIIDLLKQQGAEVNYHDPYVARLPVVRKHALNIESVPLEPSTIASHDVVLIATDHSALDYEMLVDNASLVVDTRNATRHVVKGRERIVKA